MKSAVTKKHEQAHVHQRALCVCGRAEKQDIRCFVSPSASHVGLKGFRCLKSQGQAYKRDVARIYFSIQVC